MGQFIFRVIIIFLIIVAGYFFPPFHFKPIYGAAAGFILGSVLIYFELKIKKSQFKNLWQSMAGLFAGIFTGWILGLIYQSLAQDHETTMFIRIFFLIIMPYIGYLIGSRKGELFSPSYIRGLFKEQPLEPTFKILDTSVIIDGRIGDICKAAFIEGPLVVPQFILKELQLVADSADGIKRQRGRRGLEVLDLLQKSSQISVSISETDFPEIPDVDSKLIELAKTMNAKIITNDFNLNKVAQLHGIPVLNINELANALKPVVLPGESIRVFILKEGKEKDQT